MQVGELLHPDAMAWVRTLAMGDEEGLGFAAAQIDNIEAGIARRLGKVRYRKQIMVLDARFMHCQSGFCTIKQQGRWATRFSARAWPIDDVSCF